MEYEFSYNSTSGGLHAKFSLEHELFAVWLADEVAADQQNIDHLLQLVQQAECAEQQELHWQGRQYLLSIHQAEVNLRLNIICQGVGREDAEPVLFDPELAVNDDNGEASCGLPDFSLMLHAWADFVATRKR